MIEKDFVIQVVSDFVKELSTSYKLRDLNGLFKWLQNFNFDDFKYIQIPFFVDKEDEKNPNIMHDGIPSLEIHLKEDNIYTVKFKSEKIFFIKDGLNLKVSFNGAFWEDTNKYTIVSAFLKIFLNYKEYSLYKKQKENIYFSFEDFIKNFNAHSQLSTIDSY